MAAKRRARAAWSGVGAVQAAFDDARPPSATPATPGPTARERVLGLLGAVSPSQARGPGAPRGVSPPAPGAASSSNASHATVGGHDARGLDRLGWLTNDQMALVCRSWPKAVQIAAKTGHKHACCEPGRCTGNECIWRIQGDGGSYQVILDLADLGPRDATSLVVSCECMDHVSQGPVCKHAGAALKLLQQEKSSATFRGTRVPSSTPTSTSSSRTLGLYTPDPAPRSTSPWQSVGVLLRKKAQGIVQRRSVSFETPARGLGAPSGASPPAPGAAECALPSPTASYSEFVAAIQTFLDQNSVRPAPSSGLGVMVRGMNAMETQDIAVFLLKELLHRMEMRQDAGEIALHAFTYDRSDLTEALGHVAKLLPTKALMDHDSTLVVGRGCAEQRSCVVRLVAQGVVVRLARGTGTSVHYAAVGRSGSFPGIQHSKMLLIGSLLIHGSVNWTTSSRGNLEFSTLTWLTEAGLNAVKSVLSEYEEHGVLYHDAVRESEYRAAARSAAGLRTPTRARSESPTSHFGSRRG